MNYVSEKFIDETSAMVLKPKTVGKIRSLYRKTAFAKNRLAGKDIKKYERKAKIKGAKKHDAMVYDPKTGKSVKTTYITAPNKDALDYMDIADAARKTKKATQKMANLQKIGAVGVVGIAGAAKPKTKK